MMVPRAGNKVAPTFPCTERQMSHDWCSTQTFLNQLQTGINNIFLKVGQILDPTPPLLRSSSYDSCGTYFVYQSSKGEFKPVSLQLLEGG